VTKNCLLLICSSDGLNIIIIVLLYTIIPVPKPHNMEARM